MTHLPQGFFEIAEREHEIQNPTSAEKLLLLGERLRLTPHTRVLDLACGRGGPAILLASRFRCRITGVELREAFADAARERITAAGVEDLVEVVHADAREFHAEAESYDVAMCLGASFVWGGFEPTLAALVRVVGRGGHVAVGEPYWRTWPLPDGVPGATEPFAPLAETAELFGRAGLALTTLIASSEDDWDRYESLHWRALEGWLEENEHDERAPDVRRCHLEFRDRYLRWGRAHLGWAILAGRSR